MGWGKIRKSITKPFKQAGKAIGWNSWGQDVLVGASTGLAGLAVKHDWLGNALNAVTGVRDMRNAQRAADARAAEEADNPTISPVAAVGNDLLNVDQDSQEDVTTRKRRRTGVSQSTSRGLTRVLGGGSNLN